MITEVESRIIPSKPQFDIITSPQQVNLFLSGQGGGKTECAGVVSGKLISFFPKQYGFIGANTYTQLSDSTLKRIRTVWKTKYHWTEWSVENPRGDYVVDKKPPEHFDTEGHDFGSYRGKICFKNGTVIYTGSLVNYKAHDGKEFAWAVLDETKDTKEEAVKEVITGRLRQRGMYLDSEGGWHHEEDNEETGEEHTPWNPLFIFTSPAKVDWINEWFDLDQYVDEIVQLIYSAETYFVKDMENKRVVICSTYHNQQNLPKNYIENQKKNLHSGLQDMLIYGNPFSAAGGEFYKLFIRTKHVIDVRKVKMMVDAEGKLVETGGTLVDYFNDAARGRAYNPTLPLHISWDFNVNPYLTLTIYQIVGKKIFQIDEICLSNPRNRTSEVCKDFIMRYQGHTAGVFVYGDPSGKNEDTKMEKGENNYTIIMSALYAFRPSRRVASQAPSVVMRGNFINTIFEKGYEDIEIFIHNTCTKSISDFVYLKEASDGTKLKEKTKNLDTGVTYEKYGHTSDSFDYMICAAFPNEYGRYQAGGTTGGKPTTKPPAARKNSY